jgi:hypothetical protein
MPKSLPTALAVLLAPFIAFAPVEDFSGPPGREEPFLAGESG